MAEIKNDRNASQASDQDQMANVSCVIHNALNVKKYWRSIQDPTEAT